MDRWEEQRMLAAFGYICEQLLCKARHKLCFVILCAGQTIVDDISAAAYNVVFTALPILLFALLDRHAPDDMLLAQPQLYATRAQPESHSTALSDHRDSYQQSAQAAASSNQKDSKKKVEAATAAAQRHAQDLHGPVLPAGVFWRSAVVLGLAHGAAAFFVPFYGAVPGKGRRGLELWGVGKAVYMALLTAVTLEVCGACSCVERRDLQSDAGPGDVKCSHFSTMLCSDAVLWRSRA